MSSRNPLPTHTERAGWVSGRLLGLLVPAFPRLRSTRPTVSRVGGGTWPPVREFGMDFWQGQTQAQAWIWWGGKAGQTCVLPLSHQVFLGSSDLGPVLPSAPLLALETSHFLSCRGMATVTSSSCQASPVQFRGQSRGGPGSPDPSLVLAGRRLGGWPRAQGAGSAWEQGTQRASYQVSSGTLQMVPA